MNTFAATKTYPLSIPRTALTPWLFAVVSAVMNIAIFPRIDQGWIAYFSFVPLLLLVAFESSRRLFFYFFVAGVIFNLGNLYWITHVIGHYTDLGLLLSTGVLLLLCLVLALFWGVFGMLLGYIHRKLTFAAAMLAAPCVWITLEWTRNFTTQFPWCLLGYSQYRFLEIAQLATFFGVYGLSLLVMAVNAAIATAIVRRTYYYIGAAAVLLAVLFAYGHYRIQQPVGDREITVGLVQGNIPQDVKMNFAFAEEIHQRHLRMTRELLDEHHPDLILWSEASTLFPILEGGQWTQMITDLAREHQTPILVGSDSFIGNNIYNSSFLIDANGNISGQYDKVFLVPFGEFVPLKQLFFFAGKVIPEISDFSPGQRFEPFRVGDRRFSVAICFEVVFPQLTRKFLRNGAHLLSTITNDAWFGKSSAPYQHFAMSVMRAIEGRRYLVRAANTGISGIVDPYGRILHATSIFVPATVTGKVKWIEEQTFYTRYGDILVYFAILVLFGFAISCRLSQK